RARRAPDGPAPARPGVAARHCDGAAGYGDDAAVLASERERSADYLDRGGGAGVANERLRGSERAGIGRARRRDSEAKVAEAATVLDRGTKAGLLDPDHSAMNRTRSPGLMRTGGSLALSKTATSVRPMSLHPPGEYTG